MRRAAAALMIAVLAAAGVALAAGHRHVRPSVRVASARVVAGALRFALDVSFRAPTGLRGASPCSGRVVARARHRRWSGPLQRARGGCHALVAGHMGSAMAGHRVSFRVSFRGNRRVAAFSVTRRLLLAAGAGGPPRPMLTPPPGF
jgi:hypothetical protein